LAEKREAYGILGANLKERGCGWKLGVDGRITLKYDNTTRERRVRWIRLGFVNMILEFWIP